MKFYTLEMNELDKELVTYALRSLVDQLIDDIEESCIDMGEQMSTEQSAKTVIDNVIANATHEIETLQGQLDGRKDKSPDAPWGLKVDGTPKKRPGRPVKKGKK
jgi:hypothetical protein